MGERERMAWPQRIILVCVYILNEILLSRSTTARRGSGDEMVFLIYRQELMTMKRPLNSLVFR